MIEPKTSVQFNFQAFRKSNSIHSAHCQFEADFIFTLILWNLNDHLLKCCKAAGVELIVPHIQVKVILGEDREATGILLSIDGDDGIVRMELDDQLKILNLRFLGRLEH